MPQIVTMLCQLNNYLFLIFTLIYKNPLNFAFEFCLERQKFLGGMSEYMKTELFLKQNLAFLP